MVYKWYETPGMSLVAVQIVKGQQGASLSTLVTVFVTFREVVLTARFAQCKAAQALEKSQTEETGHVPFSSIAFSKRKLGNGEIFRPRDFDDFRHF